MAILRAAPIAWVLGSVAGLMLGIACEPDNACVAGHEGCWCTTDGRCLSGLACLSERCVDPNWKPADDGTGQDDAAGTAQDDASESFDNAAACESLVDSLSCGDAEIASVVDCGVYAGYPCDIADYFDCVADVVTCTDAGLDASMITQCLDLASCP